MDQLRFSIPEIISLFGAAQCIYIIVYMAFRSGRISRAGLPLAYFLVLACAFLTDFATRYLGQFTYYDYLPWIFWFLGPPLSVLLVIQVAQITKLPALRYYLVLLLLPAAFAIAHFLTATKDAACAGFLLCDEMRDWLLVTGISAGAVSLLTIWLVRGLFDSISQQKTGKERYWLILALIFANIFFLTAMLFGLNDKIADHNIVLLRNVLGLGFVYLVSTSLFRIYPQAVSISPAKADDLSEDEKTIAGKIESLLTLEKVYQEPTYSRTDLARECETSETVISKVINVHFNKSFPQLINEYRVQDAKQLLAETKANIKIVAEEVGFNSLPSFNRVFKEIEGVTPSAYRKSASK